MKILQKIIILVLSLLLNVFYSHYAYSEELKLSPNTEIQENNMIQEEVLNSKIDPESVSPIQNLQPQVQQPIIQSEITLCIPKDQVPITLEDSLKTALENNFDIKIIATEKNVNKWLYYNSLSDFLPDVSFNYTQTRFQGRFLLGGVVAPLALFPSGVFNSINTGFTAEWEAFTGFRRYFETRAANYNYRASKKNVDLTVDQVLLLTTRQYYTLLQDKINLEILETALQQTQAQLRINQQRFEAGVGTKFDVLRAEAEVAAAKQNLISANNSLRLSQAQLANIIGVNVFAPLIPCEESVEQKTLFKDCFDLNEVTKIAIANKPELDIAELNIEATRARRNSAYSIYLPTVAVSTSANWVGRRLTDMSDNNSVSLIIRWRAGENLGLEGLTNAKALSAQLEQAKLRLIDTRRDIEQSLINSFYNILTAKELITATGTEVIAARESLRLAVVRLEAGVGIYTDVIAAQLTETQARINYLNALINYNIAQAQLLFDMGVISPSNVLYGFSEEELAKTNTKK